MLHRKSQFVKDQKEQCGEEKKGEDKEKIKIERKWKIRLTRRLDKDGKGGEEREGEVKKK